MCGYSPRGEWVYWKEIGYIYSLPMPFGGCVSSDCNCVVLLLSGGWTRYSRPSRVELIVVAVVVVLGVVVVFIVWTTTVPLTDCSKKKKTVEQMRCGYESAWKKQNFHKNSPAGFLDVVVVVAKTDNNNKRKLTPSQRETLVSISFLSKSDS